VQKPIHEIDVRAAPHAGQNGTMMASTVSCALGVFAIVALVASPPVQEARAGVHASDVCRGDDAPHVEAVLALALCGGAATVETPWGETRSGARIASLAPDGPGARAGLRVGDVIYQVAGSRVSNGAEAAARLENRGRGIMLINFWRDDAPLLVRIWPD
jgi:S1-C subfamily serine protease